MQLYRSIRYSVTGGFHNCGYYETDASEVVVSEIVKSIEKDNKLNIAEFSDAVVTILRARVYTCEPYESKASDIQADLNNRKIWLDLLQNLWTLYHAGKLSDVILSNGASYYVSIKNVSNCNNFLDFVFVNNYRLHNINIKTKKNKDYKTLFSSEYAGCELTDTHFILYRNGLKHLKFKLSEL